MMDLDTYARGQGFPDYATMQAYLAAQQRGLHMGNSGRGAPTTPQQGATQQPGQAAQPPGGNWLGAALQHLVSRLPLG